MSINTPLPPAVGQTRRRNYSRSRSMEQGSRPRVRKASGPAPERHDATIPSAYRLMPVRVLVVGERADERPGGETERNHDPELVAQMERQAHAEVVGDDGDHERDEDANDESHDVALASPRYVWGD